MQPAVDHRRRAAGAEAEAVDRLDRHRAVRGGAVPVDPEPRERRLRQRVAPHRLAGLGPAELRRRAGRPARSRKSW